MARDARRQRKGMRIKGSMVEAAAGLHAHLPLWQASEKALRLLREELPGHSYAKARVKATTLNALYSTFVLAIDRMAVHIEKVMKAHPGPDWEINLVTELAAPEPPAGKKRIRHTSFASKYAHFFVSEATFPIYDSAALDMVRWHLGPDSRSEDSKRPYLSFFENLQVLRERDGLHQALGTLDHFLWLSGLYRKWKVKGKRDVNVELARLFGDPPKNAQGLLRDLCPDLAK